MATILIVDDEEPLRELLGAVLEEAGHRALLAIHGARALELAEAERPDLVISDVMMPRMGGAELCRRLKAGDGTRAIPVILMSSAGEQVARRAGSDAFIAKPFSLDDLERLVRRWLPSEQLDQGPAPAHGTPSPGDPRPEPHSSSQGG